MGMAEYRQPTVYEAVDLIMASQTREYRQLCVRHWRKKYGDEFADEIEGRVRGKWKKRK